MTESMTQTRQHLGGPRRGGERRDPVATRAEGDGSVPPEGAGAPGEPEPAGAPGAAGAPPGAGRAPGAADAPGEAPQGTGGNDTPGTADAAGGGVPGRTRRARRTARPERVAPAAEGGAASEGDAASEGEAAGPSGPHEARTILERARADVDPALRSALRSLPGAMRRVGRYHFGWEHADGSPAAGNPGKAVRPALVLTAATALGGAPARAAAVQAAAAVELVHNFTLLHDDVMDRDTTRRHRPTAWTVFGDADAILAGDAMHALALRLLARDPHPSSAAAADRLAACVVELCEGQRADTALERRPPADVSLGEVLAMAEAKTGALLGCACALGGLYAGTAPENVEALDAFGREAGLAFQLIDDVIGIWGDPGHTGKPAGADLAARKKSLPVVAALTSGTPAAAELAALYAVPYDQGDLERTAAAVERAGGRDWAQAQAAERMSRAVSALARAVPDPETAEGLLSLAEFVTRRTA